jgi:hypothetical protein
MTDPRYELAHARGNRGACRVLVLDCGLPESVPTHALWDFTGTGIRQDVNYERVLNHGARMVSCVRAVCPDAWVFYGKVLANGLRDPITPIVNGIRWGIASKVDAISMSFVLFPAADAPPPNVLSDAVQDALDAGVGVFAGCGNDPKMGSRQPWIASHPGVCRCAWDQWIPPFATACWPSAGLQSSGATAFIAAAYGLYLSSDNNSLRRRNRHLLADMRVNPFDYWREVDLPRLRVKGVPYCGNL